MWHFPHDVPRSRSGSRDHDGRVMQFADLRSRQKTRARRQLRESWQNFLAGSMYHVAGVDAVNDYTGMGCEPSPNSFCMDYDGLTKPCGYRGSGSRSATTAAAGGPDEARHDRRTDGHGLEVTRPTAGRRSDAAVVVLTRDEPLPLPDSRLSWAADGIEVESARPTARTPSTSRSPRTPVTAVIFAALGWPGYSAELDGKSLPVAATTSAC